MKINQWLPDERPREKLFALDLTLKERAALRWGPTISRGLRLRAVVKTSFSQLPPESTRRLKNLRCMGIF